MPATYESLAPNGHSTMVTRIFQKIKSWVEGQGYSTTDEKVKQEVTDTSDKNFELLFSASDDNTTHTEEARKTQYAKINPYRQAITFGTRDTNSAIGSSSFASGYNNVATGYCSHAEGYISKAVNSQAHAEGYNATAGGDSSHAEGYNTTAGGGYSHAEGYYSTATGTQSHAEGEATVASGTCAHSEGNYSEARANNSHAEGYHTIAGHESNTAVPSVGENAHAEGNYTVARGNNSHAEGLYTFATYPNQHVQGKYNEIDLYNTYAHIIGNGTSENARSNAQTIDWDGNEVLAGMLTDKHGVQSLRHLTTAEYNALTEAEKMNGVTYHLIDSDVYNMPCGMVAYSDTITISANSSIEIDLSSLLPSGATLKGISSVSLGAYALPYIESGVVKTYVYAINTVSNKITIQNNTSAWTDYTLNFMIFYTTT